MTDAYDSEQDAYEIIIPRNSKDADYSATHADFQFDHCGGVQHSVFPVLVPEDWSLERAKSALRELFPAETCYHSHDCCGHWYGKTVDVLGEDYYKGDQKIVWARRTYIQNV